MNMHGFGRRMRGNIIMAVLSVAIIALLGILAATQFGDSFDSAEADAAATEITGYVMNGRRASRSIFWDHMPTKPLIHMEFPPRLKWQILDL